MQNHYTFIADFILVIHFLFVAFILIGFFLIWFGYFLKWSFIRNFYFRITHLVAMGIVTTESLWGIICPLTEWESRLRYLAGGEYRYRGSFIQHWLHKILFYDIDPYVFTVIYTVFFGLMILTYFIIKPRRRKHRETINAPEPL